MSNLLAVLLAVFAKNREMVFVFSKNSRCFSKRIKKTSNTFWIKKSHYICAVNNLFPNAAAGFQSFFRLFSDSVLSIFSHGQIYTMPTYGSSLPTAPFPSLDRPFACAFPFFLQGKVCSCDLSIIISWTSPNRGTACIQTPWKAILWTALIF